MMGWVGSGAVFMVCSLSVDPAKPLLANAKIDVMAKVSLPIKLLLGFSWVILVFFEFHAMGTGLFQR